MPMRMPNDSAWGVQPTIFRIEQIFRLSQRLSRSPLTNGDGLTEFGRRLQIVNTAAHDPGGGQDRAVLSLMPAVTDADGCPVLKTQFAAAGTGKCIAVRHRVLRLAGSTPVGRLEIRGDFR